MSAFLIVAMFIVSVSPVYADDIVWRVNWRGCHVALTRDISMSEGLKLKEVLELQKTIRDLKACEAWSQCLEDRAAGKVKHCYENDRRWRAE
jgi:hypothetical protein